MELTRWGGIGVQLMLTVTGALAARAPAPVAPEDAGAAIVWQESAPAAPPVAAARLAVLPSDAAVRGIRFAPDHSRVAWIEAVGDGERLVVGGVPGPRFDAIAGRYLLAAAGGPVAYAARRGDRWHPVINETVGEAYDAVSPPVSGPEGRRVAFVVTLAGAEYVRLGADLHGPYGTVEAVAFSQNGRRAAWIAKRGDLREVMVDGEAVRGSVGTLCTSLSVDHDGRQVAYWRQSARLNRLMVNHEPVLWPEDAVACWFGPGRARAYTVARPDGRVSCWHAGRRGPAHALILDVALSPDGRRLAYRATDDDPPVVVVDGARVAVGRNPSAPVFSADGAHVAWRADTDEGPVVVVDGVASAPVPGAAEPVRFSADGTQVVVGAQRGRELWREVLSVPLPGPGEGDRPDSRR